MILVTGATGFIGSEVVALLKNQKLPMRLMVRELNDARLQNLTDLKNVEFVECGDIFSQDSSWWTKQLEDVDTVLHCAWFAKPGKYNDSLVNLDCLNGTLQLAKAVMESRVKRFVGLGTCLEYDLDIRPLGPDAPTNPLTIYSAAKFSTYLMLQNIFAECGVDFLWLRLFFLYGDGEDEAKLYFYVKSRLQAGKKVLLSDGNQIRDFIEVNKAAKIITNLTLSSRVGVENVCSGDATTIRDFVIRIAELFDRPDLLEFGSVKRTSYDPDYIVGIPAKLDTKELVV